MTRRKLLVGVVSALLLYLVIEGLSLAGLWVLRNSRGIVYFPAASRLDPVALRGLDSLLTPGSFRSTTFDSTLGWRSRRDVTPQGVRDDRTYAVAPDSGVLRIAAFGDSFTYGSDVKLGENWSKRISAIDSTIEILNHGSGAYGLDQAYLRYLREGSGLHPQIVFIGYMSENLARSVNVFRAFYGSENRSFFMSKPRFRLDGDKLVLVPNPLRTMDDYRRLRDNQEEVLGELGRDDYYFTWQYRSGPLDFSPSVRLGKLVAAEIRKSMQVPIYARDETYEPKSEALQVTLRIFDAFYRRVLEDGALPVIVLFPNSIDQRRSVAGAARRYDPLIRHLDSAGYRYVDALGAFDEVNARYSLDDVFQPSGHYTSLGNDLVARYILAELRSRALTRPAAVDSIATAERARLGLAQ